MKHSKNVEGVIEWYRRMRPDMVAQIEQFFPHPAGDRPTPSEIENEHRMQPFQALLLQGFEAGRLFEKEHPEVESGIGYMND
jgi:hypothetical protein